MDPDTKNATTKVANSIHKSLTLPSVEIAAQKQHTDQQDDLIYFLTWKWISRKLIPWSSTDTFNETPLN